MVGGEAVLNSRNRYEQQGKESKRSREKRQHSGNKILNLLNRDVSDIAKDVFTKKKKGARSEADVDVREDINESEAQADVRESVNETEAQVSKDDISQAVNDVEAANKVDDLKTYKAHDKPETDDIPAAFKEQGLTINLESSHLPEVKGWDSVQDDMTPEAASGVFDSMETMSGVSVDAAKESAERESAISKNTDRFGNSEYSAETQARIETAGGGEKTLPHDAELAERRKKARRELRKLKPEVLKAAMHEKTDPREALRDIFGEMTKVSEQLVKATNKEDLAKYKEMMAELNEKARAIARIGEIQKGYDDAGVLQQDLFRRLEKDAKTVANKEAKGKDASRERARMERVADDAIKAQQIKALQTAQYLGRKGAEERATMSSTVETAPAAEAAPLAESVAPANETKPVVEEAVTTSNVEAVNNQVEAEEELDEQTKLERSRGIYRDKDGRIDLEASDLYDEMRDKLKDDREIYASIERDHGIDMTSSMIEHEEKAIAEYLKRDPEEVADEVMQQRWELTRAEREEAKNALETKETKANRLSLKERAHLVTETLGKLKERALGARIFRQPKQFAMTLLMTVSMINRFGPDVQTAADGIKDSTADLLPQNTISAEAVPGIATVEGLPSLSNDAEGGAATEGLDAATIAAEMERAGAYKDHGAPVGEYARPDLDSAFGADAEMVADAEAAVYGPEQMIDLEKDTRSVMPNGLKYDLDLTGYNSIDKYSIGNFSYDFSHVYGDEDKAREELNKQLYGNPACLASTAACMPSVLEKCGLDPNMSGEELYDLLVNGEDVAQLQQDLYESATEWLGDSDIEFFLANGATKSAGLTNEERKAMASYIREKYGNSGLSEDALETMVYTNLARLENDPSRLKLYYADVMRYNSKSMRATHVIRDAEGNVVRTEEVTWNLPCGFQPNKRTWEDLKTESEDSEKTEEEVSKEKEDVEDSKEKEDAEDSKEKEDAEDSKEKEDSEGGKEEEGTGDEGTGDEGTGDEGTGEEPTEKAGEEPTVKTGEEPTVKTGEEPTVKTDEEPTVKTDEEPTIKTDEEPTVKTEEEPTVKTEEEPTVKTDEEPTVKTDEEPTIKTDEEPTVKTEEEPTVKTEEEPTVKTEEEPTVKTEEEPTVKTEEEPTVKTEEEPTVKTEEEPTVKTDSEDTPASKDPTPVKENAEDSEMPGDLDTTPPLDDGSADNNEPTFPNPSNPDNGDQGQTDGGDNGGNTNGDDNGGNTGDTGANDQTNTGNNGNQQTVSPEQQDANDNNKPTTPPTWDGGDDYIESILNS